MDRRAVLAVLRRPALWVEGLRALASSARRGWWRRPPFLPIPHREWLAWRAATAYGSAGAAVDPDDLRAYLRWRRRTRRR